MKKYQNKRQKLTQAQKNEIARLYKTGNYSCFQLGQKFGVSGAWVSKIVKEMQ